jgi:hypothetical protein
VKLLSSRRGAILVAAVALAASFFWGGPTAAAGMALGLSGAGIGILGWWVVIRMMGRNVPTEESVKPWDGTNWVVLAFLFKLPIFFVLAFIARRVGGAAVPGFLWGLGLVYLALVGWALSRSDGTT